jgi:large subunit ribosomal protein L10
MIMVSVRKKESLKNLLAEIDKYPVVGILDMHKLPARQLHQIKEQLKGKALIRMMKKRVIKLALEQSKKQNVSKLGDFIENQPAMLFSEGNPFELAQVIAASKTKAPAKPGDIAPEDIVVPEGPTNLPPGPAIGELQKAKIQAGVEGDKIVVKRASTVARKGDEITTGLAGLLSKLDIEPMEISLNLLAVWDEGMVFGRDLLFIPKEHYVGQLRSAHASAFNLAVNIGFVTSETVLLLVAKAHREAMALAAEAGIMTSETVGLVLAKASAQADALKAHVREAPAESAPEEAKERGKEEQPPEEKPAEEEKKGEEKNEAKQEKTTEGAEKEEPAPEGKEEEKKD